MSSQFRDTLPLPGVAINPVGGLGTTSGLGVDVNVGSGVMVGVAVEPGNGVWVGLGAMLLIVTA